MLPRIRSEHDEAHETDPQPCFQGEGGTVGNQGREDAGRVGQALRCASSPDPAWKAQLQEGAAGVFGAGSGAEVVPTVDLKLLHAKIGELTLEKDFLSGALSKAGLLSAKR